MRSAVCLVCHSSGGWQELLWVLRLRVSLSAWPGGCGVGARGARGAWHSDLVQTTQLLSCWVFWLVGEKLWVYFSFWGQLGRSRMIWTERLSAHTARAALRELTAAEPSPGGTNAPDNGAAETPGQGQAVLWWHLSQAEAAVTQTSPLYSTNHLLELFLQYWHLSWSNFIFTSQFFAFFKMQWKIWNQSSASALTECCEIRW